MIAQRTAHCAAILARLFGVLCAFMISCVPDTDEMGPETGTEKSTETGNPPVIKEELFSLRALGSDLEIMGSPEAVLPGGSVVLFFDRATGEQLAEVTSATNGSFSLSIPGAAGRELAVRASNGGAVTEDVPLPPSLSTASDAGTPTAPSPEQAARPDAALGEADAGAANVDASATAAPEVDASSDAGVGSTAQPLLSCSEIKRQEDDLLGADALVPLMQGCQTASDCVALSTFGASCRTRCDALVSRSAVATLDAREEQVERELCPGLTALGCMDDGDTCGTPPTGTIACLNNTCIRIPTNGPGLEGSTRNTNL